ncbi:hypothetical protein E2C01_078030 [Portunus trituberculatus]|uniref:Uncharacterized protein n=1 Tax=Portunus trituberculatus TaxID=210409 RepID=A0A5B7IHN9_PORTR|nr:hypothetical protein [Portunus trituberculatus]
MWRRGGQGDAPGTSVSGFAHLGRSYVFLTQVQVIPGWRLEPTTAISYNTPSRAKDTIRPKQSRFSYLTDYPYFSPRPVLPESSQFTDG